jgi:DNA repair ATPase RecN
MVEGQEREREIARMLSGDHSEVSVKHAREMLRKNRKL